MLRAKMRDFLLARPSEHRVDGAQLVPVVVAMHDVHTHAPAAVHLLFARARSWDEAWSELLLCFILLC